VKPPRRTTGELRAGLFAAAATLVVCAASACSGPPGPPPSQSGTTVSRVIRTSIADLPLTDQGDRSVTLSSFRGKTVMLVPFLTLCSDICPMTSGNLLQVEHSLQAAQVADKVQIIELSVDPDRDTPARLSAYASLVGANWELVTETDSELSSISKYFGFFYQKVPQDNPPAIDWLTGKPLTYDVNHSDGYVLISPTGVERYSTGAAPAFSGTLNPKLHAFLSDLGREHLAHPPQPSWTPSDALASLGWMLGKPVPFVPA
jgi:protein SCO1